LLWTAISLMTAIAIFPYRRIDKTYPDWFKGIISDFFLEADRIPSLSPVAGLVPAIHVFMLHRLSLDEEDVHPRDKPGGGELGQKPRRCKH